MALTTWGAAPSVNLFYDTIQVVTNTNRRDVSDVLDLWVHRRTPFLNYIKWGPESGGKQIEWISEHQGRGYIITATEVTGTAAAEVEITTSDCGDVDIAMAQIATGACLLGYSSDEATYGMYFVTDTTQTASGSGALTLATEVSGTIDSGEKFYLIGNFVNEGSKPLRDRTMPRAVVTNNFAILREDFSITGSMAATDMHAVADETRHQLAMRTLRMQKQREMSVLFADNSNAGLTARTSTAGTIFDGIASFMRQYNTTGVASTAGNTYDKTTTTLNESLFNSLVANLWDAGCTPNVVVAGQKQIRNFTSWDRARVRTEVNASMGGFHVTKYLTDVGFELDLVPMPDFPVWFMGVIDTNQIKLRAKKGRKMFTEKLGVVGDYTQYQMISEYSVEVRGGTQQTMGGAFASLT